MKKYKVETLITHPTLTFDSGKVVKEVKNNIQEMLDEYASKDYILHHSTSFNYESSVFTSLYFEKIP